MKQLPVSERVFSYFIEDSALHFGWLFVHHWTSVHSTPGFPDYVLVRGQRLIFAELKSDIGRLSSAQEHWLERLGQVPGVEVYTWRPSQRDEILRVLGPQDKTLHF